MGIHLLCTTIWSVKVSNSGREMKKCNRNSRGRGRLHRRGHPTGDRRTRSVRSNINNMLYAYTRRRPYTGVPPVLRPNWWLIIYYVFIRISVTRARPRGELPPPSLRRELLTVVVVAPF